MDVRVSFWRNLVIKFLASLLAQKLNMMKEFHNRILTLMLLCTKEISLCFSTS